MYSFTFLYICEVINSKTNNMIEALLTTLSIYLLTNLN